ncbi:MAG TPA: hypothetical protein GX527_06570 [Clostridiaceae bacterium]|nr:hypothetical protein [Clostridiaceae bacterium]
MWNKFWNVSKRIVSLIAKLTFLYPIILLPRAALFRDTGGAIGFLVGLFILFAGYMVTGLIVRNKQNFARMLISYLLAVIPMVICISIFIHIDNSLYGILRAIFEGLASFILFFTGVRARFLDFDLILSRKIIITGVIIFLASIIFLDYYKELTHLKNIIYLLGYIFVAITLLIKNQQNLDRAFIQKHIDLSTVPKDIRNYNSIVVIAVFLIILVLFNINSLVTYITTVFKNAPKYILIVLFAILNFLSKLMPGGEEGGGEEQGQPQLPFLPGEESNSIVGLILSIIFGLLFLVAFIYLIPKVPKLLRAIGEKIKKFVLLIGRFLKKLFRIQKDYTDSEVDYIDEVEIIRPESPRKGLRKPAEILKIINKKLGRNLTPTEKVRNMYAVILHHLRIKGVRILKSDTTHEIYEKTPKIENLDGVMKYITIVYDKVRYGEKIPDKAELDHYQDSVRQAVRAFSVYDPYNDRNISR